MAKSPEAIQEMLDSIREVEKKLDEAMSTPLDEQAAFLPDSFAFVRRLPEHYPRKKLSRPSPTLASLSFFETVRRRESIRDIAPRLPVTEPELSTLLYLTSGLRGKAPAYETRDFAFFTSPSAGGLHGQDLYLILQQPVDGLAQGIYYYDKLEHSLVQLGEQPSFPSAVIQEAGFRQWYLEDVPVILVFVADLTRGLWKYGTRYYKSSLVDAGVLAGQAHLAATAIGLGSCIMMAFDKAVIARHLGLGSEHIPVLIMILGKHAHAHACPFHIGNDRPPHPE